MANTPEIINGKVVKRWFTRGKARIPIYEDGTIGLPDGSIAELRKQGFGRHEYQNAKANIEYYEASEMYHKKAYTKSGGVRKNISFEKRNELRRNYEDKMFKQVERNNALRDEQEDKSASKMIDYNAKTRAERYRNYNKTDPYKANANIMAERKIVSDWENGAITTDIALKRFNGNKERANEIFESMGYHSPFKDYGQAVDIPGFDNYQYYPKTDEVKVKGYNEKLKEIRNRNTANDRINDDYKAMRKENPDYFNNITEKDIKAVKKDELLQKLDKLEKNRNTGMTKQEETHSYTRQQLKDKYGTDDVDLINAGKAKEDRVSLKEEKRKTISDLRKEMATEKLNSYKDTQNHDEVQYFKNEKELEEKYESDLRFYEDFSYGLEQEFGLKMDRPDVGKYKVRVKEPKNMKTMTELQEEEIPDNYMEAELNTSKAKVERFKEGKGRTSIQDNTKQIRAEIKGMKEMETKEYGDLVVKKIGNTYAIKHKGNEDDPYTDYSSYTYGFKQKHTIEMILEELNKK